MIEAFDGRDALPLVRMWRASFEHGVGIVDPHPIDEQVAFLVDKLAPRYTIRVTRDDGAIVGFIAFDAHSVAALYVAVSHLGRGIGSALLELAKAESSGSLWLYTFARNANARRFYARHGFAEVAYGVEPNWRLDDVRLEWRCSS